jgi:hypothetical protein
MGQHPEVWYYLNQNATLYQSLPANSPSYQPRPHAYALADYLHSHQVIHAPLRVYRPMMKPEMK